MIRIEDSPAGKADVLDVVAGEETAFDVLLSLERKLM
ncbi:hypothetical protein ABMB67_002382 [Halalkalibacter oceani]